MLSIEPITDPFEITTIVTEPTLWQLTYGQGCLVEEFKVDPKTSYLGVIIGKELGGLFELKEFNKITYDAHIYLLPRYQDGQLSIKAVKAAHEYLHDNTQIYKIITTVPMECEHVHKFLSKTDFQISGSITNSIIYNNRLQDLIIYSLQIRG